MISDLANQLFTDLSKGLESVAPDKAQLKGVLEAALSKLDLVSREEFDAQSQRLETAQHHLAALEKRLSELEKD